MALVELRDGHTVKSSNIDGKISAVRKYYNEGNLADTVNLARNKFGEVYTDAGGSGVDPIGISFSVEQAGDRTDLWYVTMNYESDFQPLVTASVEASTSVVLVDMYAGLTSANMTTAAAATAAAPQSIAGDVFKGESAVSLPVPVTEVTHKFNTYVSTSNDLADYFVDQGKRISNSLSNSTITGTYTKFVLPKEKTIRAGVTITPRGQQGLVDVTKRYVIDPLYHARQKLVMDDDGRPQYAGTGTSRRVEVEWVQPFDVSTAAV